MVFSKGFAFEIHDAAVGVDGTAADIQDVYLTALLKRNLDVGFVRSFLRKNLDAHVFADGGPPWSSIALERYRIMAWAPGLAGLSFSARSAGGMGSQSSPAEERRGAMAAAQSSRNAKAVTQMNRWVRFMAKHAPKL